MATIHEITEAQTCECNAKVMPFAACCKARKAFEAWYDKQADGRIQPFDVWLAATNKARAEFDALAADAARYRWLCEHQIVPSPSLWDDGIGFVCKLNGLTRRGAAEKATLDTAIDAAMKGE